MRQCQHQVFAAVAGIMVYISLDELLPQPEKYGEHHKQFMAYSRHDRYGYKSCCLHRTISN